MAVIAQSQKTLVDLNDPVQQGTVPANPVTGLLWLDTSQSPPILKRYTGAEWEVVGDIEIGGRNLLPDTSDEYTDVVIGQYFAALGGYFDTRDYGIKAGDIAHLPMSCNGSGRSFLPAALCGRKRAAGMTKRG